MRIDTPGCFNKMIKLSDLTTAPDFIKSDTQFLCKMGSHAYGINGPSSDIDIYGFCVPPIEYLLPHTAGHIEGFGRQQNNFEQFQVDHIEELYDVSIYNITKFLHLCMDNNPNMIDCLFVPDDCILYKSEIADLILKNKKLFLHKGCYFRFMGYAESQWKKIRNKNPVGKRKIVVDTYGFDLKYASHLYRLANECEQILRTGDLNLRQSQSQMLLIRKGKVSLTELEKWFNEKKLELKQLYETSTLQHSPDQKKIKDILIQCLEMKFGSLKQFTFKEE